MPKKSHRIASRQAAISRERKRKKRSQASHPHPMPAMPAALPIEPPVSEPPTGERPTVTVTQPPPSAHPVPSRYRYVIPEIRKIAIIAAVILAVLIVLTFILG